MTVWITYTQKTATDSQKFFVTLLSMDGSSEVPKMVLLLLHCLAPDSIQAERGFSLRNLTQEMGLVEGP